MKKLSNGVRDAIKSKHTKSLFVPNSSKDSQQRSIGVSGKKC
jgi:hypothetical protein